MAQPTHFIDSFTSTQYMHVQCDHQNGIFSKDQVNSKVPAQKSKGYNKNYQGERKLTCSNRRAHQGTYREHVVE